MAKTPARPPQIIAWALIVIGSIGMAVGSVIAHDIDQAMSSVDKTLVRTVDGGAR